MRPEILFPLFGDISSLKGIGPRIRENIVRLLGEKVVDLLFHMPSGLIDRRARPKVGDAKIGALATLNVTVGKHISAPAKRAPYRVTCYDETGEITLTFFHGHKDYLQKQLPEGEERIISGTVERYGNKLQMTHPDYILAPEQADSMPLLQPIYPLTAGVSQKVILKAIHAALERVPDLPEWQDKDWIESKKWPHWKKAIEGVHTPSSNDEASADSPARRRLAYDELFANQLALSIVRRTARKKKGHILKSTGDLRSKMRDLMPYSLTGSQKKVIGEIDADMAKSDAMVRLVQGDVGSGKTIVAFISILSAIENGGQAALMSPTEILAKQHYEGLNQFCDKLGIRCAFLSGAVKGAKRKQILADLAQGNIDLIIGTHALFQDDVDYKNLVYAVIDEQHRFGVHQRLALTQKNDRQPDMLVMTATPIPRTLTLTLYGDMDVSRIDEKPPGRFPIETRVVALNRIDELAASLQHALDRNERIYWVCPLVEDSDVLDLTAAEERFDWLKERYGAKVGLVHGQMKSADKDAAMAAFERGDISILVATTVIEVGVDVPEATVMIIEHAERFGLSQLHQLRGRVGRSARQSSCVLLRDDHITETARARLKIMRDTEDGFLIAEEDLRLRGSGEILGSKQSGYPVFRVVDLNYHTDLLKPARDDAKLFLSKFENFDSPRANAARILLYLFEREDAIKLMASG